MKVDFKGIEDPKKFEGVFVCNTYLLKCVAEDRGVGFSCSKDDT